ncbi:MAG: UDP-3-O-(3-hydroxymyristoyl)glucosamine N-acyltransferase [Desulfosarcinaceae bacterium]
MQMTLGEIAALVHGEVLGDAAMPIRGVAPLDLAGRHEVAFAERGPALKRIGRSDAGAVLVPKGACDSTKPLVLVENPRLAFTRLVAMFHPPSRPVSGIHPTAVIGRDCRIGADAAITAGVVIGDHAVIGDRVTLHPNVVVGNGVVIGDDTVIHPLVAVLEGCRVGARVIIHAGTVIGSDGYGFVQDEDHHVKIPQIGIVRIDDDVEIGANNTIDRATFGETWIKKGVKTDNQVHIAHNVEVGEHTLLVAQAGIAGSTKIGHHVIIAGQSGIGDHLEIGNRTVVAGRTGVAQSIPEKQVVSGAVAAMPHRKWLRMNKILPALPDMQKKLRSLEERVKQMETHSGEGSAPQK